MIISGIDKDFIEIIDLLNNNGFRPWSSCDGVLNHHSQDNKPINAYISFLKSEKIIDLLTAISRDESNFSVTLSNNSYIKPYECYGNIIEGNKYQINFENKNGERTEYFKKIIRGIVIGEIIVSDTEKERLQQLSDCLDMTEDSELNFVVELNRDYQLYMKKNGKTNSLTVLTKNGIQYNRNMQECAKLISEKYGITLKKDDFDEQFEDTKEFIVPQFDKCSLEYYFSDSDLSKVLGIISYVKSLEKELSTFEAIEPDYDDFYID